MNQKRDIKNELKWTGERYLPWMEDGEIHYEHIHRYAFASQFVKGKRVLDLASGEGYGSDMLSREAEYVLGIDIDELAINHAKNKYIRENLKFLVGSMTDNPLKGEEQFDVVVCFEAIEHINAQERLLDEVKKLLNPDGLFIVSTPNKKYFEEKIRGRREFHVRELYFEEFKELLQKRFKNITFFSQHLYLASLIWALKHRTNPLYKEFIIEKMDNEFHVSDSKEKLSAFFAAVASDSEIDGQHRDSFLIEIENKLLDKKNEIIAGISIKDGYITSLEDAVRQKDSERGRLMDLIKEKDEHAVTIANAAEKKDRYIKSLEDAAGQKDSEQARLRDLMQEKDKHIGNLEGAIEQKDIYIKSLEDTSRQKDSEQARLGDLIQEKDKYVRNLQSAIEKKDKYIKGIEEAIEEKRNTLEKLYAVVEDKDKYIKDLKAVLEQKENIVNNLTKELTALKGNIFFKAASKIGLIKYILR